MGELIDDFDNFLIRHVKPLGMLIPSLVFALCTVLSLLFAVHNVRNASAYTSASTCTEAVVRDDCVQQVKTRLVEVHHGNTPSSTRNRSYGTFYLDLSGPPSAPDTIILAGSPAEWNTAHQGDAVVVTLWHGSPVSVLDVDQGLTANTTFTPGSHVATTICLTAATGTLMFAFLLCWLRVRDAQGTRAKKWTQPLASFELISFLPVPFFLIGFLVANNGGPQSLTFELGFGVTVAVIGLLCGAAHLKHTRWLRRLEMKP